MYTTTGAGCNVGLTSQSALKRGCQDCGPNSHHRFGFFFEPALQTWQLQPTVVGSMITTLSKITRSIVLDQNSNNRNCTRDLDPPTHQKQCKFVRLTPLRSVRHQIRRHRQYEHIWSCVSLNIAASSPAAICGTFYESSFMVCLHQDQ